MKKIIFTATVIIVLQLIMQKRAEAVCDILPAEQFTTGANFSTGTATTTKYWSPSTCSTGGLIYSATGGCTGGYVGKTGAWNNYFGCFLRTPQANCTGNSFVTLNFDISNSFFSSHPNDGIRFYMWVDGGYKKASMVKTGGIDVGYTDANGLWLKFDQARSCVNVDVVFDLTTSVNLSNILFYLEPNCGYNDASVFSVALDNISLKGSSTPIAEAGNNASVCEGASTQLNATGGISYTWSPSSGLNSVTVSNPLASPSVTTTYYVTVADACGSAVDSVVITVEPVPATPVITATGDTLHSSEAIGNQWYNSTGMITGATGNTYIPSVSGNYYVIVTDSNGCNSDTSNVYYISISGVNLSTYNGNFISIFLNPATDDIIIENNYVSKAATIFIYNIEGRLLLNKSLSQDKNKIAVSGFAKGLYFVKVKNEMEIVTRKFVKK